MKKKYDVVVIGAGPAGSICARNLARRGYDVLLAEKRPVVGVPVRCGEATGTRKRISDFTELNENWIETDINGVIIYGPKNTVVRYDKPGIGMMLDRKLFDQDLASQAKGAGADLQLNARVAAIGQPENSGRSIKIYKDEDEFDLHAKMVVGCDGVESLSGQWVGLKSRQLPPSVCSAIEFRIEAEDENPNHLTFWQGHESINKGYVWVFPKVKSKVINLGAGALTPKLGEKNMYQVTMEFKERMFPDAKLVEIHGGGVPVSGCIEEYVADHFLLAGDSAHHTNPMTGGGIVAGMCAADFAAAWIDKAFKVNDFSRGFFKQYEQAVWNRFGRNHQKELKIRDFVLGLSADDQARFYDIFKGMIKTDFNTMGKMIGYGKLIGLGLGNWRLARKAFF